MLPHESPRGHGDDLGPGSRSEDELEASIIMYHGLGDSWSRYVRFRISSFLHALFGVSFALFGSFQSICSSNSFPFDRNPIPLFPVSNTYSMTGAAAPVNHNTH